MGTSIAFPSVCLTLLVVCGPVQAVGKPDQLAALAGGNTTVFDSSRDAFSRPAANLEEAHRADFFVGNSFFNQNWVAAPASTAARDGLGPLFNARSCSSCHFKDGRSAPPELDRPFDRMIMRISVPGPEGGAPTPDPTYGGQIQGQALPGASPEADVFVDYETIEGSFPDGESYSLRRPAYRLERLGYGPVSPRLRMSPRVAPAVFGMGLLEAIPEQMLRAMADPDDRNGDGISGRLNLVKSTASSSLSVGRFGWKAEQPSIEEQTAAAFQNDMGLSTSVRPAENHSARQEVCDKMTTGGSPEVSDSILHSVVSYCRTLAVPAARNSSDPAVQRGERLFHRLQCASCHTPESVTGASEAFPELSGQRIRPYTDLLLHDLGEDLSDHRPVFQASGAEWRTPPLWGLGLMPKVNGHSYLLHDGRARNPTEAILWHGGEARAARDGFIVLPRAERQDLIHFLESL